MQTSEKGVQGAVRDRLALPGPARCGMLQCYIWPGIGAWCRYDTV